jgi:hypothetical protein
MQKTAFLPDTVYKNLSDCKNCLHIWQTLQITEETVENCLPAWQFTKTGLTAENRLQLW